MTSFLYIERLSAGGGRFGKVYKYTDRRSMFSYTATRVKLDCLDPWNQDKNIIEQVGIRGRKEEDSEAGRTRERRRLVDDD